MKRIDFNSGWLFHASGKEEGVMVTTPHDAMLHEKRENGNPSGSAGAYFAGGAYEYEKDFQVPGEWAGKQIIFRFEGVYQTAVIYLNDQEAGRVWYGYGVTEIEAGAYLKYGEKNRIRVAVDNSRQPNSRWYSGAGIYRPVWLYVLDESRIELHGVRIRTVSHDPAVIEVKTAHTGGTPKVTILDGEKKAAAGEGNCVTLEIPHAGLWSDENPYLYRCRVELVHDGKVTDSREESFGIRTVKWSSKGLFVNGKEVLLRGGCIHHDNGVLGACGYEEAEWRRVRIMKENGFNAIRSSHNPCTGAMLEACDALGMYMMDETWDMWYRHKSKYDYADLFMEHFKEDLKSMVDKDYNHPSVIFYSIGNEVSEPASEEGLAVEKEMTDYLHELDPSRAVTAGLNLMIMANAAKGIQMYDGEGGLNADSASTGEGASAGDSAKPDMAEMDSTMFNMLTQQIGSGMNHAADSDEADAAISPGLDLLDIAGYNYASGRYPLEGDKHPERIIFGSETFPPDIYANWSMVKQYPYLIGDFMWTAWDYLGEAGIGQWTGSRDAMGFDKPYPWLLGGAGVINILGDADGEALYAKAVWGLEKKPRIAVRPVTMPETETIKSAWRGTNAFPSWSYRGCGGRPALVEVYGPGDTAELVINGISREKKKMEQLKAIFETVYEPGFVEVVVYDGEGKETGRDRLVSAEGELHLEIREEGEAVSGKLLFVNISLCGENGVVERNADEKLELIVSGGELLGFGSANPRTEESYPDNTCTTYYGRSLAVIRAGNSSCLDLEVQRPNGTVHKSFAVKPL